MARCIYLLAAFTVLSAWAGAQNGAPPLNAEDKLRLLKSNGTLIDSLVNEGVEMSRADTQVKRVEKCRNASRSLVNAIQHAAEANEAERVAELTGLFRTFTAEALLPTIADANQNVPPESPDGKKLRELRDLATRDLSDVKAAIGRSEKASADARVKETLKQLDEVELK